MGTPESHLYDDIRILLRGLHTFSKKSFLNGRARQAQIRRKFSGENWVTDVAMPQYRNPRTGD
jgi:hypothetical protein